MKNTGMFEYSGLGTLISVLHFHYVANINKFVRIDYIGTIYFDFL